MTKILNSKAFKGVLALLLVALLALSMVPFSHSAYGKDSNTVNPEVTEAVVNAVESDSNLEIESEGEDFAVEGEGPGGENDNQNGGSSDEESGIAIDGFDREDATEDANSNEKDSESESGDSTDSDDAQDSDDAIDETDPDVTVIENEDAVIDGTARANRATLAKYTDGKSYTLTVNGVMNGHVIVAKGSTLTIEGTGTIDAQQKTASYDNRTIGSAILVDGGNSTLNVNGSVTVTGGTGTLLNMSDFTPNSGHIEDYKDEGLDNKFVGGGGILVQRNTKGVGATLNFYNGTVSGNKAKAGGGILIDRECGFYMKSGTVDNNVATVYEGGGIWIAGNKSGAGNVSQTTYIESGTISNNTIQTTYAWGGGGIFVESKGVLKLGNSLITDNQAGGLGGGISGCPHAHIGIGHISEGFALYNNHAGKANTTLTDAQGVTKTVGGQPKNPYLRILNSGSENNPVYSGDMYAYGLSEDDLWSNSFKGQGLAKPYSKDKFDKKYAQDYYCTKVSYIHGYDLGQPSEVAWEGYTANRQGGQETIILKGQSKVYNDVSVGLTNKAPSNVVITNRAVEITGNTSYTHGGGIGCNGSIFVGPLGSEEVYNPISFEIKKDFKDMEGDNLGLTEGQFKFELLDADGKVVKLTDASLSNEFVNTSNKADGTVVFRIKDSASYLQQIRENQQKTFTFKIREIVDKNPSDIIYDVDKDGKPIEHTVEITIGKKSETSYLVDTSIYRTTHTPVIKSIVIDGKDYGANNITDFIITNQWDLEADWTAKANKYYYGTDKKEGQFEFVLQAIKDPGTNLENVSLNDLIRSEGTPIKAEDGKIIDDGVSPLALNALNAGFAGDVAQITFPSITYKPLVSDGNTQKAPYTFWYMLTEKNAIDPTVYVFKVTVEKKTSATNANLTNYVASTSALYYADSLNSTRLTLLEESNPTASFYNLDINLAPMSFSSYAVNALSGQAVDQKCLVDPKIYKKLEGRSMKPGEFHFKLIQVNNFSETNGDVISSTSNDENGMVDFDAANNINPDPNADPCCLEFSQPGTYYYRVIEDRTLDTDSSVEYSPDVITFTAVIELDEATGKLECTDMYYGRLVNGENIREENSSNPQWHPTVINNARPVDLKVQKTSVLDRTQGLEGATYGLYAHNSADQDDIFLGESISDKDGWITFKDVSLQAGKLYYFKEKAAPAGHTVSEFRSSYFYLVPAEDSPTKFVMRYTDSEFIGDEADESNSKAGIREDKLSVASLELADNEDGTTSEDGVNDVSTRADDSYPVTGDDGTLTYIYTQDNGVYDEATRIDFHKLDTRTHEWVEGAQLAVIDKATGAVVNSWTSGKAEERLEGVLNVGTVYILRELQAPEGYIKANDVEFTIDDYGNLTLVSGEENGNAEIRDSALTLYNTMADGERVIYEERTQTPTDSSANTTTSADNLPKTGDEIFAGVLMVLATVILGAAGVLLYCRLRRKA